MSSKLPVSRMMALIGIVCLLGGVVASILLAAVILQLSRLSVHFSGLWLALLISFMLVMYGVWVLRMAFSRTARS